MSWRDELNERLREAGPVVEKHYSDVVIVRRSDVDPRTGKHVDVFAVTEPGSAIAGTEYHSRTEADVMARQIASDKRLTVWYQHDAQRSDRVFVETYRRRR